MKTSGQASQFRWYQVRLRVALLLLTLIGVALGAWTAYLRPYLDQALLLADIRNRGGVYESRPAPSWLRLLMDERDAQNVTLVNIADTDPSQSMLQRISHLWALEILVLGGETITDDKLQYVPDCDSLQAVILDSTKVSDAALAQFRAARPGVHISRCDRRATRQNPGNFSFGTVDCNPSPPSPVRARLPQEYYAEVTEARIYHPRTVIAFINSAPGRLTGNMATSRNIAEQFKRLADMHRLHALRVDQPFSDEQWIDMLQSCQVYRA